jgi:hypothetical protein
MNAKLPILLAFSGGHVEPLSHNTKTVGRFFAASLANSATPAITESAIPSDLSCDSPDGIFGLFPKPGMFDTEFLQHYNRVKQLQERKYEKYDDYPG